MSRQRPARREPLPPPPRASGTELSRPVGAWAGPASGLHAYALGLTWRLGLTVVGYLVLLFALQARSAALAKFMGVIMPLLALATGLVMLVGLTRFTRHPADSRARSSAIFAAVVFGVAFALEIFGFLLVLKMMVTDPSDWEAMRDVRETAALAGKTGVWALALGFAHLLALLVSFHGLGRRIGNKRLAGQAISVGAVVFCAAGLVLSIKWWLPHAEVDSGLALLLAITTLGVAIVAVAIYIRLVNVVADNLLAAREHDLPESRIS